MGAGNMSGAAGRNLSERMRQRQGGSTGAPGFDFGASNEMSTADPAFGEEKRDADLSTPEGDAPEPNALRAVAGARRDVPFGEQMPGDGAGIGSNMQPDMGPDQPFDFAAMMGGPKQQYEEQVQSRSPIPGQSLQAGQQAAQIRASLTERRGADAKRRMPTMDDEYLSL